MSKRAKKRSQHAEISVAQTVPATPSQSAFESVPNEVLELILANVRTAQEIVKLTCVCKRWKQTVQNMDLFCRYMDLGPLLIDTVERLRIFHSFIKKGLGTQDFARALQLVIIGDRPLYGPISQHTGTVQFNSVLRRQLHETLDHSSNKNFSTIGDLDKKLLRSFGEASEESDLLAKAWDELTYRERHSRQWCTSGRIFDAEIGKGVGAAYIVTGLPLSGYNMHTVISQLCRDETLHLHKNPILTVLVLLFLSSEKCPVRSLNITNTSCGGRAYAEHLENGASLSLEGIERLQTTYALLNAAESSNRSCPQIKLPHLLEFRMNAGVDFTLLRAASSSLKILELPRYVNAIEPVLQAVFQLENLETLYIGQQLRQFCKEFSTITSSGGFPCPRLQEVTLHDRPWFPDKEISIRSFLQPLVEASCMRMRILPFNRQPTRTFLQSSKAATRLTMLKTSERCRAWSSNEWSRTILYSLVLFPDLYTDVHSWAKDQETRDFLEEKFTTTIAGRNIDDFFRKLE